MVDEPSSYLTVRQRLKAAQVGLCCDVQLQQHCPPAAGCLLLWSQPSVLAVVMHELVMPGCERDLQQRASHQDLPPSHPSPGDRGCCQGCKDTSSGALQWNYV